MRSGLSIIRLTTRGSGSLMTTQPGDFLPEPAVNVREPVISGLLSQTEISSNMRNTVSTSHNLTHRLTSNARLHMHQETYAGA
jgi:hypothetical protein